MISLANLPSNDLGIKASQPELETMVESLFIQTLLNANKNSYVTYNKFGFSDIEENINESNWLIKAILEFVNTAPVLDIGAGYGSLAKKLLSTGNKVVINDIEEKHLLLARQIIDKSYHDKLYLKPGRFPSDIDFPSHSFSSIILFRVILFLSPQDIEASFKKISKWLIPGGKIFICTLPPQRGEYHSVVMPIYESRWQQGDKWPGLSFNVADILPNDTKNMPETIHLMDERPLKSILTRLGFTIERYGLIENNRSSIAGKEIFGLIAKKVSTKDLV